MKKQQNFQFKSSCILLIALILFSGASFAQEKITVSGSIVDNSNVPIIGASIIVQGTTDGTITDMDGNFSIPNVPKNGTLKVSYVGYVNQIIAVNNQRKISIKLMENLQTLDEVVVVGYGVQRKSDLTGAVASVKATEILKNTPTTNISDALQGRMAGVSVVAGGDPSVESTIRIRGINSINAESGPLVVVDGFVGGNLKSLNPADIQSIEVLKDASATAVYGSRGANGVILVTTKTAGKDKVSVSMSSFTNIKTVLKYPDTLSPGEFARLANDYGKEYRASQNLAPTIYYTPEQIAEFDNGTKGYDYVKNMFNDPAISQNYELSISGKSNKTSFLASARYENTEGIIRNSNYQQFNWRLKLDTEIRSWLKTGLNFWGDYNNSVGPRMGQYEGLLIGASNYPNTVSPQDANGNYNNIFAIGGLAAYNPMGFINEMDMRVGILSNRLQAYADFTILEGLNFRTQIGVTFRNGLTQSMDNEKSYYFFKNAKTQASAKSSIDLGWLNTNILSYVKEFNKDNRINASAVFEQMSNNSYNHTSGSSYLAFSDLIGYNGLSWADAFQSTSNNEVTALLSGMFRINYTFKNRYMITTSIRADGSSNLDQKWDYFPSLALAWDMKKEAFLEDVNWLDQFKVRVGYGSVGNQSVAPYRIYSKMEPVRNPDGSTSYVIGRPKAPNLKWERNDQINTGIDFSILNGRITASMDYYNKLSTDILLDVAQPVHTGWPSLLLNAGSIRNTGVEFTFGAVVINNKDLKWNTDLTVSHNKGTFELIPTRNKMQKQAGLYENEIFKMIEGEKLGTFWGYQYEGVWKTSEMTEEVIGLDGKSLGKTNAALYGVVPGQAKYKDLNKDGLYNDADQGIIGNGQPMLNWGWNNSVSYKNFDFGLFIVGFHGFDIYNASRAISFGGITGQATDVVTPNPEFKNRWTPQNENTDIPGFVKEAKPLRGAYSDRFVEKGDFLKVKSITLGYNLSQKVCKTLSIDNFKIYGSVQNPFHITQYSGLDPEATLGQPLTQGVDWGAYPNGRNYIVGINLSF